MRFFNIVIKFFYKKAKTGGWDITNIDNCVYNIPFGLIVEKRDDTTVRAFLIKKHQFVVAICRKKDYNKDGSDFPQNKNQVK